MADRCCYCGTEDIGKRLKRGDDRDTELRPYGPGGSMVCYTCATESPERERDAERAYGALSDANALISPSGAVLIGEQDGPRPFTPGEARP